MQKKKLKALKLTCSSTSFIDILPLKMAATVRYLRHNSITNFHCQDMRELPKWWYRFSKDLPWRGSAALIIFFALSLALSICLVFVFVFVFVILCVQTCNYLPWRGSAAVIMFLASNICWVSSGTVHALYCALPLPWKSCLWLQNLIFVEIMISPLGSKRVWSGLASTWRPEEQSQAWRSEAWEGSACYE